MSKTKNIKPYADAMAMMVRRDLIPETDVYETLESTPSRMDDSSSHLI